MDSAYDKATELRECAAAWEPGVRLLGNVRADEIIGILDAYEARIAELDAEVDKRQQTLEGYFIDLAATATLDRLREVVPEGDGRSWSMLDAVYHILYPPTPETPHEMD